MKYIRPIHEIAAQPLKIEKNEYSTMKRSELLDLADAAVDREYWGELEKINAALSSKGEDQLSHMNRYPEWSSIRESIDVAKQVLRKIADREFEKKRPEIEQEYRAASPEERKDQLENHKKTIEQDYLKHDDFLEIQQLLHMYRSYIGAFVKFRFLQGASMDAIRQLARLLSEYRDQLKDIPIDEYANRRPKEGEVPGWEALGDEFNRLSQFRRGKWIVDSLIKKALSNEVHTRYGYGPSNPVNQQELFKNASKEKKEELLMAAKELEDLGKPEFKAAVRKELGGCATIDKIIDVIRTKIKVAQTPRGDIELQAISKYPSVAVIYSGPDHLVLSFRSEANLADLCSGAKEFCLNPAWAKGGGASDLFWNYAFGALQLIVIDYSVDSSNPFHTTGITIKKDKSVSSLCDARNYPCITGADYRSLLLNFRTERGTHAYPQELVDAIEQNFDRELEIKNETDRYYKEFSEFGKGERDREKAMLARLLGVIEKFGDIKSKVNSGSISSSELSANSKQNLADQILAQELANFKNSPAIEGLRKNTLSKASEKGLHSPAEVKLFELIMKDSPELKESNLQIIIEKNTRILTQIEKNLAGARLQLKQKEFWDTLTGGLRNATEYLEKIKLELQNK
jgi:hypothetical protein